MKFEWLNFDQFQSVANSWDDLWQASTLANPLVRSENLVAAVDKFYSRKHFRVGIVRDDENRIAAGIPFVQQRLKKFVNSLALPNNPWGLWGDLVVDAAYLDKSSVYSSLVDGIFKQTSSVLRLNLVDASSNTWSRFLDEVEQHGQAVCHSPAYYVGLIRHRNTWEQFRTGLSKGFQKKLRRYARNLSKLGAVSFEHFRDFNAEQVAPFVKQIFEIEDAGWKGAEGSSVIASDMLDLFQQTAAEMAGNGELRLSILKLNERPIAFEFGSLCKDTYSSIKIGYLDEFAKHAPGQVLAQYLTEALHATGCLWQDTFGPLSDATARWTTHYKLLTNCTVSARSLSSRLLVEALKAVQDFKSRSNSATPMPAIGILPNSQNVSNN